MASTSTTKTKTSCRSILSEAQRKEYAAIFVELDTNGDGWMSRTECSEWLLSADFSLHDRQIEAIFRLIDLNQDGRITLDEFFGILELVHQPPAMNTTAAEYFQDMDTDKDGYLSIEELQEGLKRYGHHLPLAKVQKFVANLDKDEDGRVSINEFLAAFQ